MKGECLKIVSYNCQGLGSKEKRRDVLNYLKSKLCYIYLLQDTHFTEDEECQIRNQWEGECLFNSYASNQRGVAILFNNNFEFKFHKFKKDEDGNLLALDVSLCNKRVTLINIYGPNSDSPAFYNKVSDIIDTYENQSVIVGGDYNLVQDFNIDTFNYVNINNPRAREKLLEIKEVHSLIDPYRELYPESKRFTWRKKTPLKQARLDFFLISDNLFQGMCDVQIDNSYRSDHSPVIINFQINSFIKGRGLWKFNNSLLYDKDYVTLVKETMDRVKKQYAVFVYNYESLKSVDNLDIHFNIDDQLFLETLLMEIRGKTISYATYKKREKVRLENKLVSEIRKIEENLDSDNQFEILEEKKGELRILRQDKVRGQYIRSRTQWAEEGEKTYTFLL